MWLPQLPHVAWCLPPDQEPWAIPASPLGSWRERGSEVQGVSQSMMNRARLVKASTDSKGRGQDFHLERCAIPTLVSMQCSLYKSLSEVQTGTTSHPNAISCPLLSDGAFSSPTHGTSHPSAPQSLAGQQSWRLSSASAM